MSEDKKEPKEEKVEDEYEVLNDPAGEEGEEPLEESEEGEEVEEEEEDKDQVQEDIPEQDTQPVEDADLIPDPKNFSFTLNPNLLSVLNDQNLDEEKLLEKIIKETVLNSNKIEEIGLYIYIHFLFRNSYQIFIKEDKNIAHNNILYFVDSKISPSFNLEKILQHITDNNISFSLKENQKQTNKTGVIIEFVKKEISKDDINPSLCCKKRYDKNETTIKIILNYNLVYKSMNSKGQHDLFTKLYTMYLLSRNKNLLPITKSFLKLFSVERFKPFNKDTYLSYVDKFLKENNEAEVNQIMEKELKDQVKYFTEINDKDSLFYLEKLLIQLIGHYDVKIRKKAVVLLNIFYDGHNFQLYEPFNPEIRFLNDEFKIEILYKETPEGEEDDVKHSYFLFLSTPLRTYFVLPEQIDDENKMTFNFGRYQYCGYYDFVLIRADNLRPQLETKGRYIVQNYEIKTLNFHEIIIDSFTNNNKNNSNEKGSDKKNTSKSANFTDNNNTNNNNNTNVYSSLIDQIKKYSKQGINALHLIGALDRDNSLGENSSPFSVVNRSEICPSFGSEQDFINLVKESKQNDIKIFLDSYARISSSHFHRKYKKLLLNYTDKQGKVQFLYGAEGNSLNYEDNMVLNYRDIDAWNLLVTDILSLVDKYNISGIHFDNAQLWPNINSIDYDEMFREEVDEAKNRRYSNYEIINGAIVLPNEECGFWNAFDIENLSEDIYPNPLFIKITKSIWDIYPEFIFLGEYNDKNCKYNNRQYILSKSGIIPKMYLLPEIFSHLYEINLGIDPLMPYMRKNTVNNIFKAYNDHCNKHMPKNIQSIISSGGDIWPYPNLLLGNGSLPYITALFTMNYIPLTFMDEINGEAKRNYNYSYFESSKVKKDNSQRRPTSNNGSQDLINKSEIFNSVICKYNIQDIENQISKKNSSANKNLINQQILRAHYEKMRQLRNNHKSLLYGKLHFLKNENSKVLSFSRIDFEDNEIAIVAINFGNTAVCVDIDFSSVQKEYKHLDVNTIIKIEHWSEIGLDTQYTNYYFMEEVFSKKHHLEIMPYDSVMLGFSLVKPFNVGLYHKTFAESLSELCKKIAEDIRKTNKNDKNAPPLTSYDSNIISSQLNYLLNNNLSLCEFAKWLNTIQSILSKYGLKYFDYFKNLSFISENWKNSTKYFKYISLLNSLPPTSFEKYPKIYLYSELIKKSSNYGPICFITPEIGRWSTVTNLGTMIDQLTRCLSSLGQDIYVISPYYLKNKDGKTGYLETDKSGFICLNTFEVMLDKKYEFDIYFGKVNGVKLYFMKNEQVFPSPFPKGNVDLQMLQYALMGKASLAVLCNIGIIPSLIVSCDYFAGLVPAYGKGGHFGETFKRSVFFHISHNIKTGDEGSIRFSNSYIQNNKIYQIDQDLLLDKKNKNNINPTQCALLKCDQWGTISKSFMKDLQANSALSPLLKLYPKPFGYSNGIFTTKRTKDLKEMLKSFVTEDGNNSESEEQNNDIDILNEDLRKKAKDKIQQKFFGQKLNDSTILLSYNGELNVDSGVMIILENAEKLIQNYGIQILVAGKLSTREKNKAINQLIENLSSKYPHNFYAVTKEYRTDSLLINYGSDFGLIPYINETGNVTQHEFFICGTPVIAYKTGGIIDTVSEYNTLDKKGNGIVFGEYDANNFISAVIRAIQLFNNKKEHDICRKNALESARDVMDVARAWATEFYRLKGKIFFDNKEVEKETLEFNKNLEDKKKVFDEEMGKYNDKNYIFNYDTNNLGENEMNQEFEEDEEEGYSMPISFIYEVEKGKKYNVVEISGSWDNWKEKNKLKYDPLNNRWRCIMILPKGKKYLYKYLLDGSWTANKNEKLDNQGETVNNQIEIF